MSTAWCDPLPDAYRPSAVPGRNAVETILLVLEQDPVPPRVLNPRANPDLEMVGIRCLQKAPSERYASAAALADDLDAFGAGRPVSARSTSLPPLAARLLGETHNAAIMENWGVLWICHSFALVAFFSVTNVLLCAGVSARWPYVLVFTVGLGLWAAVFWAMRRRGGPISFVKHQLAHVSGRGDDRNQPHIPARVAPEMARPDAAPRAGDHQWDALHDQGRHPVGARFYLYAGLVFLAMIPMVWYPRFGPLILALPSAFGFFATGLQYHRRLLRSRWLAAQKDVGE